MTTRVLPPSESGGANFQRILMKQTRNGFRCDASIPAERNKQSSGKASASSHEKAIGREIPSNLLALANRVIE